MDEIWKDVPGFEGRYSVSNKGKVKSLNYGNTGQSRNLKPNLKKDGYYDVALADSGKYRYMRVHRLVALAFIPNPNRKTVINHINGVKTDNRVENLEWCTPSENTLHASKNGLLPQNTPAQIEARKKNVLLAGASNKGRKVSVETRMKMSIAHQRRKQYVI